MGNRAVITTENKKMGVYLHWNGGKDSVKAFLTYCKLKGYRSPSYDESYAFARLTQVIGNYFGGTSTVGIDSYDRLDKDNGDNGVYIIGEDWEIVGREFFAGEEQDEYDLNEMIAEIDSVQPAREQLGDYLTAEEVEVKDLAIGDKVYYENSYDGEKEILTVVGFGDGTHVNGRTYAGVPYVDKYGDSGVYNTNPNNYLRTPTVRRAK